MKDELNPNLMFNGVATELLIKIVKGEIDAKQLAEQQLANRGIDENGKWVGF